MRAVSIAIATSLVLCLGAGPVQATPEDVVIEELRAKLKPPVVDPDAEEMEAEEGQAWLRSFTRGERSREQFHVGVDLPLDLALLGIDSLDQLDLVTVELFVRDEVEPLCTLVPDEIDMLEEVVEFAADVRVHKGEMRTIGDCGGAIPMIEAGDSATVFLNGTEILSGTFEEKQRGRR